MATAARASAPPNVARAGASSNSPERTIVIASSTTGIENTATRRDQTARRESGSSKMRGRIMSDMPRQLIRLEPNHVRAKPSAHSAAVAVGST